MKITSKIDQKLADKFATKMLERNLWWSYRVVDTKEEVFASPALQELLVKQVNSIDDLMGKYATPLPRLKIEEALSNYSADLEEVSRFVVSFETKYGKRSYQNQLQRIHEDSDVTFLVTCADVTEMVEFEREIVDAQGRLSISQVYEKQELLENQNKVIKDSYAKQSRFLGLLSHELRSPLLGISSLVNRLREKCVDDSNVQKMLKTISMTAQQSTYLVNDILTYTQAEYDGLKLHPSQTSLSEVLENVKQLTKSLANDKNLNLSVIKLVENDQVFVDSVRLTQVLNNLIINGIKFTEYGGVNIEVTELTDRNYRFVVSDSGEGIPPSSLDKIFRPFAQIESEDNGSVGGSRYLGAGLGLFVVKELINTMGGVVHVSSEEKVGTQFEFTLNLSVNHQSNSFNLKKLEDTKVEQPLEPINNLSLQKESSENDLAIGLPHFKVLIADDSEINRMVLVGYLDELHCQVVEAVDGRDAWKKLQKNEFDYVLLDIQMPWLDGIEVAKKLADLKATGKQQNLKAVFAITAGGESGDFDNVDDLIKAKIFDKWLVKPVNKSQIMNLFKTFTNVPGIFKENENLNTNIGLKNAYDKSIVAAGNIRQEELQAHHEIAKSAKDNIDEMKVIDEQIAFDKTQIPINFHHLITPFVEEMEKNLQSLNELNELSKQEKIKELAHYMKGNAMLFQLDSLVGFCKELEDINSSNKHSALNESKRQEQTKTILDGIDNMLKAIVKAFLT